MDVLTGRIHVSPLVTHERLKTDMHSAFTRSIEVRACCSMTGLVILSATVRLKAT